MEIKITADTGDEIEIRGEKDGVALNVQENVVRLNLKETQMLIDVLCRVAGAVSPTYSGTSYSYPTEELTVETK